MVCRSKPPPVAQFASDPESFLRLHTAAHSGRRRALVACQDLEFSIECRQRPWNTMAWNTMGLREPGHTREYHGLANLRGSRVRVAKYPPATNPHPQRGFPFIDISDLSAPSPPPRRQVADSNCRGSFAAQSLSTAGANNCSISINEISRNQQTINKLFRVVTINFLASDPQGRTLSRAWRRTLPSRTVTDFG
jgi:hypothetical protein